MNVPRVVLDTNILVAGLRSRNGPAFRVLSLVGSGNFETAVSVPLVFEYEDVLARERIGVAPGDAEAVIDYLCKVSHRQEVHFLWRPHLKDPKDDLVLELAVASDSTDIITYNIKDFAGAKHFGIRAVRPGEFLTTIGVNQ